MTPNTPLARLLAELPPHLHGQTRQRYAAAEAVLHTRLHALYGAAPGFVQWQGELMAAVGRLIAARPAELLAQDAARAHDPAWFTRQHMLGYSAYVQQFGGTLRGVMDRVDHLRDLGVTYLHLLPFLRARAGENDGGFAVASFDEVEPALGLDADLLALSGALRGAGISLCSDLILNHVADDHAWAQGAAAGDASLREFFHVFPERADVERFEATLGQVFPEAAPGNFTWVDSMGGWVWTTFYPFQWDLNYANPNVFAAMVEALLRLANRGVEVFRLDSTAFLWKREGTSCMNQPEAHTILQAMRAIVDLAAPGVLLKAEAIVPTADLPAYFGEGQAQECHLAYHSTLMAGGWAALAQQDTSLLRKVIAGTPALPGNTSWLTYVRCHDDIGWAVLRGEEPDAAQRAAIAGFYHARGGVPFQGGVQTNGTAAALAGLEHAHTEAERADALARLMLVHGLALSFGGLPVLYMGDETGTPNDHTYLDDPGRAHDTRWVQRAPFDQARAAQRLDPHSDAGRVYLGLRALVDARRGSAELAADTPCTVLADAPAPVLALLRGERFLNLSNFSGQPVELTLSAIGAGAWPGQDDLLTLAPWQMLWLAR
jgi:amylosucrase